jgi:hypothetical protein
MKGTIKIKLSDFDELRDIVKNQSTELAILREFKKTFERGIEMRVTSNPILMQKNLTLVVDSAMILNLLCINKSDRIEIMLKK